MQDVGYVELDGAKLWYQTEGDGPPVVLAHAGIVDHRMWDDQVSVLVERYKVIRFDFRGHGLSTISASRFANYLDVGALIDDLRLPSVHLVGASLGGQAMIDFALENPSRVKSLTLMSATFSGFEFEPVDPDAIIELIEARKGGDFERAAAIAVRRWVDGVSQTPGRVPERTSSKVSQMAIETFSNQAAYLKDTGFLEELPPVHVAEGRLDEMSAPVLIVVGELDDPNVVRAARLMEVEIPNARAIVIPETAHFPNLERPDLFNSELVSFLNSVERGD